jgi:hypothetical protein
MSTQLPTLTINSAYILRPSTPATTAAAQQNTAQQAASGSPRAVGTPVLTALVESCPSQRPPNHQHTTSTISPLRRRSPRPCLRTAAEHDSGRHTTSPDDNLRRMPAASGIRTRSLAGSRGIKALLRMRHPWPRTLFPLLRAVRPLPSVT